MKQILYLWLTVPPASDPPTSASSEVSFAQLWINSVLDQVAQGYVQCGLYTFIILYLSIIFAFNECARAFYAFIVQNISNIMLLFCVFVVWSHQIQQRCEVFMELGHIRKQSWFAQCDYQHSIRWKWHTHWQSAGLHHKQHVYRRSWSSSRCSKDRRGHYRR